MRAMNRLARFFSRLSLLASIGLVSVILWDRYTPPAPPATLEPINGQIDRILIDKSERKMTVFQDDTIVRTYEIALGFTPEGDKMLEGDGKTPEGIFKIDRQNDQSAFHLSLGLNYPLAEDRARAAADGVSPGGDIFIHGQPNGRQRFEPILHDWTDGCIALSDAEIEELWGVTPIGTEVEITP